MKLRSIRLLETDKNKKGDLFGRLISDLFYSLGYKEPRFNIHKSGREIDISSTHRTERKIAIAECKAHEVAIGGSDINKFVGVLDAERKKAKISRNKNLEIIGYFISISGFKETAIEQESDLGNNRVILIDANKIVEELVAGKILVSIEKAISCIVQNNKNLHIAEYVDLYASEKGWVWVLYYSNGQMVTHFTFVHAEGKPLIKDLADELIILNKKGDKSLSKLNYIVSQGFEETPALDINSVQEKYFKYLENECGDIQFDGLPTDKDSGSVKVKLENIFVPLHLIDLSNKARKDTIKDNSENVRVGVGEALSKDKRIAILAKPGGGKSTLIKRIAIAYAYSERKYLVDDNLPDIELFPVFIRCRDLGNLVRSSITEIINSIPVRAELFHLQPYFQVLVTNSLQRGNALILIDGLDEISEERDRLAFVNQLRTFLSTYPNLFVITTSREAGFRAVSGAISNYCSHYILSTLNEDEIIDLTIKWHQAIIDDTENTKEDALSLANLIIKDHKINALASNPLLLTTLLFVKRYVGYLPTKRNVLYQEMIKLLLVTWNVEGYEQLDIEETEPQLSYVAFWMTQNGKQSISSEELKLCLIAARKQMPDILDYTKISVSDFIRRVESRSSLLIMAGHKQSEDGLMPIYEFLHLSFQEYLTAKAIVEKYFPENGEEKSHVDIINPYFLEQNWKEVIPLVAVLLKRQSKPLIDHLIEKTKYYVIHLKNGEDNPVFEEKGHQYATFPKLLGNCLAYDIQITPEILDEAIEWYIKSIYNSHEETETVKIITNGKFGDKFKTKLKELYLIDYEIKYNSSYIDGLSGFIATISMFEYENVRPDKTFETLFYKILNSKNEDKVFYILSIMQFAFEIDNNSLILKTEVNTDELLESFIEIMKNEDSYLSHAISWAFVWLYEASLLKKNDLLYNRFSEILIEKWLLSKSTFTSRFSSWALCGVLKPTMDFSELRFKIKNLRDLINNKFINPEHENDRPVAIYVGMNVGMVWNRDEIGRTLKRYKSFTNAKYSSANVYASYLNIDLDELKLEEDEYNVEDYFDSVDTD